MPKARILVVDDQLYFRVFFEEALGQEGYEVETAESGEEALRCLETGRYDIVLTDIVMPGMAGIELVERIRERAPDQDIVVVTSVGDVQTAVDAMRHGATDYLLKPIAKAVLLRSLETLQRQRRLGEEHARLMAENLEYMGVFSLYERAISLFSTLSLQPLADRIAEGLSLETGAQGAVVWVVEATGATAARLAAVRGIVRVEEEPEEIRLDAPPAELAELREGTGRAFFGPGPGDEETGPRPLVVPLMHAGRLLGLARLTDELEVGAFGDRDRAAAEKFAEFAGRAIANALRFRALEARSFRDSRTKAYTSAYFEDVVRNEIQKANRFGRTFSLMRIDLDAMASVRQRVSEGDQGQLLEEIAQKIGRSLRSTDLLAADGEDCFLLLLPETDALGAAILKRRVREAAERSEALEGPEEAAPRLAVGSVTYPADGTQIESLRLRLEERTDEDRQSRLHHLDRGGRSFGGIVERLTAGAETGPARMTEQIARHLLGEILRRPHERGVLFLAPGTALEGQLREGLEAFRGLSPKTEIVWVADQRPATGLPVTWVSPVRAGTTGRFLVYCGEAPAYALVEGESSESERPFFHSDDRSLVEHLAFELGRDLGIPIGA